MSMQLLVGIIVAIAILLIVGYFLGWIGKGGTSAISCVERSGHCQDVCHDSQIKSSAFKCPDNKFCCMDKAGFGGDGGDASSGSTGYIPPQYAGHQMWAYEGLSPEERTAVPMTGTEFSNIKISNEPYNFVFKAKGDELGMCIASILYKDATNDKKRLLPGNRVVMTKAECEKGAKALQFTALTDHLDKDKYENFYLEFIAFDEEFGTTTFDPDGWDEPDKWVATYSKVFYVAQPSCSYYNDNLATVQENCGTNPDCVYCLNEKKCVTIMNNLGYPDKLTTCISKCDPQISRLKIASDGKTCIPNDWPDNYCLNDQHNPVAEMSALYSDSLETSYASFSLRCTDQDAPLTITSEPENNCGCDAIQYKLIDSSANCPSDLASQWYGIANYGATGTDNEYLITRNVAISQFCDPISWPGSITEKKLCVRARSHTKEGGYKYASDNMMISYLKLCV